MPDLAARPGEQERLLLLAALGEGEVARQAWLTVARGLDIDVVAHETHALFGRLADNLRSLGLQPDVLPRLDGVRKRMWANNSHRVRRVLAAREDLAAAGIASEPTGGLAVLLRLGDPAVRPIVDAELAVDANDVERAGERLVAAGWRPDVRRRDGWLMDLRSATFVRDDPRGLTLRWRRGGWPYATADDTATTAPTGEIVHLPAAGRLLAYTLIEGYRLWGYNPTRRYADAMLLVPGVTASGWADLVDLTRERNAAPVVSAALAELTGPLHCPVPESVVAAVAELETGRRGRLATQVAERSGTAAAFLRRTQGLRMVQAVTSAPSFLQDVWELDGLRQLPRAVLGRWRARRNRRVEADRSRGQ